MSIPFFQIAICDHPTIKIPQPMVYAISKVTQSSNKTLPCLFKAINVQIIKAGRKNKKLKYE